MNALKHRVNVHGESSNNQIGLSFGIGFCSPCFSLSGFVKDEDATPVTFYTQFHQLIEHCNYGLAHILAIVHGHRLASNSFERRFDSCFAGLAFGLFQILISAERQREDPREFLQYDFVRLRVGFLRERPYNSLSKKVALQKLIG